MKDAIIATNRKVDIGMIIYMFIFLFEPPFVPKVRGLIYLVLYSCFILMCRYKKSCKNVWKRSGMFTWLFGMILFLIYTFFTLFVNICFFNDVVQIRHYIHTYGRYLMLFFSIFFCSTYLIVECERKKYTTEDLIKVVLYAGLLQAICTASALLFPNVKYFFVKIMSLQNNVKGASFYALRAYGFSRNIVDGFGLGTGIIAGLSCLLGKKDKKYLILSLFLLLVPLLNSRTGLVVYMIAIVIYILGLILEWKISEFVKTLVVILGCIVVAYEFYQFLAVIKPELVSWVENGVNGLFLVLKGKEANGGSMATLMQDSWWELPDGVRLFIGTGHTRYCAEGYLHTDVGYVNDIWFVGVFGIILLYGTILHIFNNAFCKVKQRNDKLIVLFLFVSFVVFNVKACAISYYPGTAIIFTITFMYIYQSNKLVSK